MAGHVEKKKGRWYPVVDLGVDGAGKRQRQWHKGYATKKEASAALVELVSGANRGAYVEPSQLTVESYLVDEWLPAQETRVAVGTFKGFGTNVRSYIVPRIGALRLQDLRATHLNVLYAGLAKNGNKRTSGPLGPKSIVNVHTLLHKAFKDAVRWGHLVKNPAADADPPRVPKNEKKAWTPDDVQTFFDAIVGEPMRPVLLTIATTGMRRGEALGLRWSDVDLDAGTAKIVQTVTSDGFGTPKTDNSRRAVPLAPVTIAALRAHRKNQNEDRMLVGPGYRTDLDLVFAHPDGTPLRPTTVLRTFQRHVDDLGLPKIGLHGLRHTWATIAMAGGISPKIVSDNLGHASVSTTLDLYSHVAPSIARDATDQVVGTMFGTGG